MGLPLSRRGVFALGAALRRDWTLLYRPKAAIPLAEPIRII
jgi:hypothetical protein